MDPLWLAASAVVLGLLLLIISADRFIEGAVICARYLGMSPLLVGILIVGFGTSTPEIIVSVTAALDNVPQLALGNAYGSNISNIALILGITAILMPLHVQSKIIQRELPLLALITLLSGLPMLDGNVSFFDALGLLTTFSLLMFWSLREGRREENKDDPLTEELAANIDAKSNIIPRAVFYLIFSLIILILSSRILVWGSVEIARYFGISELIIGLTIIAIGTSLPELASSIAAVRRNEPDIALGNVIGSNLFNTLAVLGIAGIIQPFDFDVFVLYRDWPVMLGFTMLLCYFALTKRKITRLEGASFLGLYVIYLSVLIKMA